MTLKIRLPTYVGKSRLNRPSNIRVSTSSNGPEKKRNISLPIFWRHFLLTDFFLTSFFQIWCSLEFDCLKGDGNIWTINFRDQNCLATMYHEFFQCFLLKNVSKSQSIRESLFTFYLSSKDLPSIWRIWRKHQNFSIGKYGFFHRFLKVVIGHERLFGTVK